MFDDLDKYEPKPPIYEDVWRKMYARALLFLTKEGFVSKDENLTSESGASRYPWVKPMGFGATIAITPMFCAYEMDLKIDVQTGEDQISIIKTITATIVESEDEDWKDALRKKITLATERAMTAMNLSCPHCGGKMRERKVRAEGQHQNETFYGCTKYPICRGARFPWSTEAKDDEGKWAMANCPDCGAPLVIRYAKRGMNEGHKFYGCKRFPKCKRIVDEAELAAIRLMQGEEANHPWEWVDTSGNTDVEIK